MNNIIGTNFDNSVKLLPSCITVISMTLAIQAINLSIIGNYISAIKLIIVCSLLDILDGRVARHFNASTDFGAQLDSLSDFLCFGIAPAIISMQIQHSKLAWGSSVFFAICASIRLAKFNVSESNDVYFSGMPSPIAGILTFLPMSLLSLISLSNSSQLFMISNNLLLIIIGLAMISPIPTISTKKIKLKSREKAIIVLLIPIMLFMLLYFVELLIIISSTVYFLLNFYFLYNKRRNLG